MTRCEKTITRQGTQRDITEQDRSGQNLHDTIGETMPKEGKQDILEKTHFEEDMIAE